MRSKSPAAPSEEQHRNSRQRTSSAAPALRTSSAAPAPRTSSAVPTPTNSRADQVRQLHQDLAEAMEDHDLHRLRGLLPAAERAGVDVHELEVARHIMDTSMQQEALKEIEMVRQSVLQLSELVQLVEGRASKLSIRCGDQVEQVSPEVAFDETMIKAFLDDLGERIQAELRSAIMQQLEEVVTTQVRQHVAQATQEVSKLAKEVRDLTSAAALAGTSSNAVNGPMTLLTEEEAGIQKEMAEDPKSRMSILNARVLEDQPVARDVTSEEVVAATKIQASFRGNQVRKMQTQDKVGDTSERELEAPAQAETLAPDPAPNLGSVLISFLLQELQ